MYLSRVLLDVHRRETMRALSSPQLLHGAVERSFNGDRQRNLWRIDRLGDNCYLLLLSPQRPDLSHIAQQFGFSNPDSSETKDYIPFLQRLQQGQKWQFRLCANPVRSSSADKYGESGRGKVFAHVTQEQQKQWLLTRAGACGFALDANAFDIVQTHWKSFYKGTNKNSDISIRMATFEGVLTVSDLESFRKSLLCGIGRAKAYGCGLLTIAHIRGGEVE